MGKKVKKKAARSAQKEKRFPTSSPKTVSQEIVPASETVVDGVSVIKETKTCPHLDKGIDLEKFSLKMASLESLKCDDCREGVADKRTKKGKGKQGKNKGGGGGSKSESTSIWVCLVCGHFSCGGVGFPTTPQSHAARHAKQNRHPLVLQFANPNLRWCFPCNTLIPVQNSDENGEQKDSLSDFVKVLRTQSSPETRVDVEDIWFGSGSVTNGVNSKSLNTIPSCSEIRGGYMARGLVNLGNTCFFNSILQNLLAMDKLRDYLSRLDGPVSPLSASLKKLFIETGPPTGARNVINPRSFFSCVCAKAPQFRGYQQHDSHELLRCLLDGLYTEESGLQKRSQDGKTALQHTRTFVDTIFGGQISSTVSCLECGHASVVYEPYLDLSLPLPTKRSPSKKISSVSRSKKSKVPPKRQGNFRSKTKKTSDSSVAPSVPNISTREKSTETPKSVKESTISSNNLVEPDYVELSTLSNNYDNFTVDSSDVSFSLDYSDPSISNDHDAAKRPDDVSVSEDTSKKNPLQYGEVHQSTMETSEHVHSIKADNSPPSPDESSWLDYLEPSSCNLHDTESCNQDSGNCNEVSWEDEPLQKVQESEVLLLPYREVTLTSGGNEEHEPSDFDGFGGLFDEPELPGGPTVNPISNGVEGSGLIMATINSESDPDEVDDNDSPVSVEKCLAYFTTPELLTKSEHAWQCEQCSKSLLEQRTRLKNKLQKSVPDGGHDRISIASSDSGVINIKDQSPNSADLALHNGKFEECKTMGNSSNLDTESCSVNGPADKCSNEIVEQRESLYSSEDEEVDSKSVKVARDASKRILISRAPPVLTIHLKRFCQDARGRLSKSNGHVSFKDTIDLKPYMDPSCCRDRETYKYRLIGVVEHLGTMRGGHYVAYVKGGAKGNKTGTEGNNDYLWYHASDAYVREVSLEEVLRSEAYILFYEEILGTD